MRGTRVDAWAARGAAGGVSVGITTAPLLSYRRGYARVPCGEDIMKRDGWFYLRAVMQAVTIGVFGYLTWVFVVNPSLLGFCGCALLTGLAIMSWVQDIRQRP
jgi:hypothetical protein